MTYLSFRRRTLLGAGAAWLALAGSLAGQDGDMEEIAALKPGDFVWHPERQPDGPLAVVVSLPQQLVHVYRNGVRIGVSTCSSGKPGHETPTGVFVVLQKHKNHHSSTYNNAPMPNMNRLTWSGIALHAGQLPGYPASHGCVRLPMAFSTELFSVTHLGTPVVIAGAASDPWELTHPGLVLGGYADSEFQKVEAGLEGKKAPQDWTEAQAQPVTSIVASSADKKIMLLNDEQVIAESALQISGDGPLGNHILVLHGADSAAQGMRWTVVTYTHDDDGTAAAAPDNLLHRISASPDFTGAMASHMHPGMVAVLTDLPLAPDTRTGDDFVIMDAEEPAEG